MYLVKIKIGKNYRVIEDELTLQEAVLVSGEIFDHKSEVTISKMETFSVPSWLKYLIPWHEEYLSFHAVPLPWPWSGKDD